ncbi:MAG: hypothetical protein ABL878_11090 [Burkholderiales bacterium]
MSEVPNESGDTAEQAPWWKRSPMLAGAAALVIGLGGTLYAGMLQRMAPDQSAALGYVLMLPFLLIVPVFSAAGLRLAWLAYVRRESSVKYLVVAISVSAAIANWIALVGFFRGLWRIFGA